MDVIINFIKHFKLVSPTGGPETESPSDISKQITSLLLFKTLS